MSTRFDSEFDAVLVGEADSGLDILHGAGFDHDGRVDVAVVQVTNEDWFC